MTNRLLTTVTRCRLCGSDDLTEILNLGTLSISGYFPSSIDENVIAHPLVLMKCNESDSKACGLVQLQHNLDGSTLYNDYYGYRSGLNLAMKSHLKRMYDFCCTFVKLKENDLVIDIAGNDGTFLNNFPENLVRVSIDPLSNKFAKFYKKNILRINEFFDHSVIQKILPEKKAKLITSFSVLYDVDDPGKFAQGVATILDKKEGIWVFEQSYLKTMIANNSFDTICHEHLLYFSLKQINILVVSAGLKIVDVELTDTNGGSIIVVCSSNESAIQSNQAKIDSVLNDEKYLSDLEIWNQFKNRISQIRTKLIDLLTEENRIGRRTAGIGASTKGGILLEYFGLTSDLLPVIGDVNPEKFGHYMSGSRILIQEEQHVIKNYDTFIVLPWHFKEFFLNNSLFKGKKLIFPLPSPECYVL